MISITKSEAETIREKVPTAHIVRTAKQRSKRHHYFCEETRAVMTVLRSLRGIAEPSSDKRRRRRGGKRDRFNAQTRRVTT